MTHYESLANAIVVQAADDYRNALRYLKEYPRTRELEEMAAFREKQWRRLEAERKAKGLSGGKRKYSREELLLRKIEGCERDAEEIERFFRSDWYCTLTSVDGEMLIRRLREEIG